MTCDAFKTYVTATPENHRANDHRIYAFVYSEQWLDNWPTLLIAGGMTCDEAKAYIAANWQTFPFFDEDLGEEIQVPRIIAKAESFFDLCAAINFGSNGGVFNTRDLSLGPLTEIGSSLTEFVCTPSPTYQADGTWGLLEFEGFVSGTTTWTPSVEAIATLDIDGWFPCVSECGGGGINPSLAPHFVFPRPTTPPPVGERATTPFLESPIVLSNHTYQFQNNFGVSKK